MAVIPKGQQFGHLIADAAPRINIPSGAFDSGSGAAAQGAAAMQAGETMLMRERVEAGNYAMQRQDDAHAIAEDIKAQVESGVTHYSDAAAAYQKRMEALEVPRFDGLDAVSRAGLERNLNRANAAGLNYVTAMAGAAERKFDIGQASDLFTRITREAAQPGADMAQVMQRLDAGDEIGNKLWGAEWANKKQALVEGAWDKKLLAGMQAAGDDPAALGALKDQLADPAGPYAGRLPPELALLRGQAIADAQLRAESRQSHLAQRSTARVNAALADAGRAVASGMAVGSEMWQGWQADAKGTPAEAGINALMHEATDIRQLLQKPLPEQAAEIAQRENAATPEQAASLTRLRSAFDANYRTLCETPLAYVAQQSGIAFPPLDVQALLQGGGAAQTSAPMQMALRDRALSITALRDTHGPAVAMRPLLDTEVRFFADTLNSLPDADKQTQAVGMFRQACGDDGIFADAMRQLAPDAPAAAHAGLLMTQGGQGQRVAATLLRGDSLLRSMASGDGKPHLRGLMPDAELENAFLDAIGNAFAGDAEGYRHALRVTRAQYLGHSIDEAADPAAFHPDRLARAMADVIGAPYTQGGHTVLMPLGMPRAVFRRKLDEGLAALVDAGRAPPDLLQMADDLGYRPDRKGSFVLTYGPHIVLGLDEQPLTVEVQPWG